MDTDTWYCAPRMWSIGGPENVYADARCSKSAHTVATTSSAPKVFAELKNGYYGCEKSGFLLWAETDQPLYSNIGGTCQQTASDPTLRHYVERKREDAAAFELKREE